MRLGLLCLLLPLGGRIAGRTIGGVAWLASVLAAVAAWRLIGQTDEGVSLGTNGIINRRVVGETRFTVAWDQLSPRQEEQLAEGWDGDTADAVNLNTCRLGHLRPAAQPFQLARHTRCIILQRPLAIGPCMQFDDIRTDL